MKNLLLVIVATFYLAGCATGPSYTEIKEVVETPTPSSSRVIFYRTKESALFFGASAHVSVNDEIVGYVPIGGFIYIDLPQGKHNLKTEITAMAGECELALNASPEQSYYFEISPISDGFFQKASMPLIASFVDFSDKECSGGFSITPVTQEHAHSKIEKLNLAQ